MKISTFNFTQIITFILCLKHFTAFNYINFDPNTRFDSSYPKPPLTGSLKKDLDFISAVEKDGQLTACLVIVRNSIVGINPNITLIMRSTKQNKSKVFDKILATMLKNCLRVIDTKEAYEILTLDNITMLNHPYVGSLVYFDANEVENNLHLDTNDVNLLNIIYKSDESLIEGDQNLNMQEKGEKIIDPKEDMIGKVMMELEKTQTRFVLVGIAISFFISYIIFKIHGYINRKRVVKPTGGNMINHGQHGHKKKRE